MGDKFSTLSAGIIICKALNMDCLHVKFKGFDVTCHKDSNLNNLVDIHDLKLKLQQLGKP